MKQLSIGLGLISLLPMHTMHAKKANDNKPNILFLISVDHSVPFLGCYGTKDIKTPNFDIFAGESMVFDRAYVTAPQSAPSRSSFYTGRSPISTTMSMFSLPLPAEAVTYADICRQNGYFTGVTARGHHQDGLNRNKEIKDAIEKYGMKTFAKRFDYAKSNGMPYPEIVNWIVFNEHWGLYDLKRLTEYVMAADPSRLVTENSGIDARKPSIDYEVGHIKDNHSYRPPHVPLISSERATVNGEYGAIGYLVEGHVWNPKGPWVHYNYKGKEEATVEYEKFIGQLNDYIKRGLSAAVYTQWTDVESEMNGIYTYDRKVIKLDKDRVSKANKSTYREKELSKGQTDAQHLK